MNLENFMDKKIKDAPKMVKESPGRDCAQPEKITIELSVQELLEAYDTVPYHTKDGNRILVSFHRKKQRGNTVDSEYKIWDKTQCLDVMREIANGRQDMDFQWVEISAENVEFNKELAGEKSPDYIIMKSLFDKYGFHYLGQDGQQTFSILNAFGRHLISSDVKLPEEVRFTEETIFQQKFDDTSVLQHKFPTGISKDYTISEWPTDRIQKIKDERVTIKLYKKLLYSDISKIFENKNKNSSPKPAEVRTTSTNLISWVSSFITATKEQLRNKFETYEKSMPLELETGTKVFVPLESRFGTTLGESFKKYIGDNIRMESEELFQKLLLCSERRGKLYSIKSSLVTSSFLDNLVSRKIDRNNLKLETEKLKKQISNFSTMFSMFKSVDTGIVLLSKQIGFITDLNNLITDILAESIDIKIKGKFGDDDVNYNIEARHEFNPDNLEKFITAFVKEWNRLVGIKKKFEVDSSSLDKEELDDYKVIESTDSFKCKSINIRTKFWKSWYDSNRNLFLKEGVLLTRDLQRFFTTADRVTSANLDGYKDVITGGEINPIEVWTGTKYHGDHWEIAFANGGYTILANCKALPARENLKKGSKSAKKFMEKQ